MRELITVLYVLGATVALPATASAQGSISGLVITEDRDPISGASVYVEGTGIGTLTGFRGRFRLENLRTGQYPVVAEAPGYAAVRQNVVVADGRISQPVFVLPALDEVHRPSVPVTPFGELGRTPNVLVQTEAYCVQEADSLWLRTTARAVTRSVAPEDRVLLVPRSDPGRILTAEDTVPHVEDPELARRMGCLCGVADEAASLRSLILRGYYVPVAENRGFRATFDLLAHRVEEGACEA